MSEDEDEIPEATPEEQAFLMSELAVRSSAYGHRISELEAENARLREALEAAAKRFTDIAAGRAFQPRPHAATGATEARAALADPATAEET